MLFRGSFVHTPTLGNLDILEDYLLDVDDHGYIASFSPAASPESVRRLVGETPYIIPPGSFLLPTFCDLHLHAPQFLYQGTGLHLPLMEWLNEYAFKAEESLDADPALAAAVYKRLAQRLLENGTGSVLLFGTLKIETNLILAREMQSAGLRAFVGKLSMDISSRPTYVEVSADASVDAARDFACRCLELNDTPEQAPLVEPVLTPRFVPTCSDELLSGLGALSRQLGLRIQSHMAESHDQVNWVRTERGAEDMDVFSKHDLLTARTIQAHCTFLDAPSLARVKAAGTSIAHCPLSNAYFSSEPFRLREALDLGVKVGLGTDIAGGYSASIMDNMRQAVVVSRLRDGAARDGGKKSLAVDWKEALYIATRGGAIALGLPDGAGTFAVGAPFDAQCLKLWDPTTNEGVGPLDFFPAGGGDLSPLKLSVDILEKWWCLGDSRNRTSVWVQGKKTL